MTSRVRVFIAASLDGFIAGPGDDLSWLPKPDDELSDEYGFDSFFAQIGAVVMGRNTFEVVSAFEGDWPYADRPVFVPTHRPLTSEHETVRVIAGSIEEILVDAQSVAGTKDVYLEGGQIIRQALEADLVDEIHLTIAPIVLGHGTPLFAGLQLRKRLQLRSSKTLNDGVVQLTYQRARITT